MRERLHAYILHCLAAQCTHQ